MAEITVIYHLQIHKFSQFWDTIGSSHDLIKIKAEYWRTQEKFPNAQLRVIKITEEILDLFNLSFKEL